MNFYSKIASSIFVKIFFLLIWSFFIILLLPTHYLLQCDFWIKIQIKQLLDKEKEYII
jgi:hypothetical protein